MDSRLRRSPPDRASAVPYGQAGENAMRFPRLAHRSAAAHKLHSTTATTRYEFDSGEGETFSRQPALAYSPRKLSKQPEPSHSLVGTPPLDDRTTWQWVVSRDGRYETKTECEAAARNSRSNWVELNNGLVLGGNALIFCAVTDRPFPE